MYFIGLDIGTQGARVIISSENGSIIARTSSRMKGDLNLSTRVHYFEQDPQIWWAASRTALLDAINIFKISGFDINSIKAIAVDGTSGTIVPLGKDGNAVRNALMYKDSRAATESTRINNVGFNIISKLGYRFKASFALPKILWIKENEPENYENTRYFIHQTDYIVGRLTGVFNVSDHLNALKTGFDLLEYRWPDFIEKDLGIDTAKLPEIIKPGKVISKISKNVSDDLGFPKNISVVAGMTDSNASLFSSGATAVGDLNSTIGTTLAIKGITSKLIKDSLGRVYCHLHPEKFWLPGGASSIGGECLEYRFKGKDYGELDKSIFSMDPSGLLVYPLVGTGERFPFVAKEAKEFIIGKPTSEKHLYKGYLEGVAYIEKLAFGILADLDIEIGEKIYITGGGAKSDIWSHIRADILGKQMLKPVVEDTAMGAAVIAASKTYFNNIIEASKNMVSIEKEFNPRKKYSRIYSGLFDDYKDELIKRKYI